MSEKKIAGGTAQSTLPRSAKRSAWNRGEVVTAYLFLLPLLVGIALFFIVPIAQTIGYSFTKWKGVGIPEFIGLRNYVKLFTRDSKFSMELKNSLVFVLGSIPATLAVSVIIAAMMNGKVKGQSFYRTVYFLPNVTMVAVVVMIWRWLLNSQYGIVDIILDALFGIRCWISSLAFVPPGCRIRA